SWMWSGCIGCIEARSGEAVRMPSHASAQRRERGAVPSGSGASLGVGTGSEGPPDGGGGKPPAAAGRGARGRLPPPGRPGPDPGLADLLAQDLGVALQRVVDQEAIRAVADEVGLEHRALEARQLRVAVPRLAQDAQALAEVVGSEVGEPGALARGAEDRLLAEVDVDALAPGEELPLHLGEPGRCEVVDADRLRHGGAL